jgi:hypothetical protein
MNLHRASFASLGGKDEGEGFGVESLKAPFSCSILLCYHLDFPLVFMEYSAFWRQVVVVGMNTSACRSHPPLSAAAAQVTV